MPDPQKIPDSILKAARGLPAARAETMRLGLPMTADALRTKPPVPDLQNAAPLYRRIHTLLEADRKINTPAWDAYLKPTRTEKDRVAARAAVQRLAPVLTLARQAAARPRCDYARPWGQGATTLFPEYFALRFLARLLAAQSLLQMDMGDPLAAAETLRIGGVTCRHLDEPFLITFLVRAAMATILNKPFTELLNRFGERAEVLTAVERANEAYVNLMDLMPALRGEIWYGIWDFGEYRAGRWKDADMVEYYGVHLPNASTPSARKAYGDAWETRFLEYYNRIFAEARKPGSTPRTQHLFARQQGAELERRYKAGDVSYLLSSLSLSVTDGAFRIPLRGLAEIRLRRVALSALQQHVKTGQFPDALPVAVTDPFTDTPLRYRRNGAEGFIVYSVSANGKDDGGDTTVDSGSPDATYLPNDISLTIRRAR